jgi:hypothetical protein
MPIVVNGKHCSGPTHLHQPVIEPGQIQSSSQVVNIRSIYERGSKNMKNQKVTNDNFVPLLSEALQVTPQMKESLLQYARQLVQSINERNYAGEIDNPVVPRAVRLYLRANPERGNIPPSLPELIYWLRGRRGLDYTARLEKKLNGIRELMDSLGVIDLEEKVTISTGILLSLRILSTFPEETAQDD